LKRLSQKSLLPSRSTWRLSTGFFQREGSLWVICGGRFNFSPFEKGGGRGILRLFKKLNCYNRRSKKIPFISSDKEAIYGPL
jgi:hypothetical protein